MLQHDSSRISLTRHSKCDLECRMYQGCWTLVQPGAGFDSWQKMPARNQQPNIRQKGDEVPQKISRDARTGEFVSPATARRRPASTTTEFVGAGTSNTRVVNRSAGTGQFITDTAAKRNPGGT